MADLFGNGTNNGSRDEFIQDIVAALLDAANSSRQFSNELKENTKNASKLKRDTQSVMMGLFKESKELAKDARELDKELKDLSKSFPQTVERMLASTEKGLAFQTRKFDIGFKLEKMLNPIFNNFKLMQKEELNSLREEIKDLDELMNNIKDDEERATYQRLKDIKLTQEKELKGLDTYQVMQRQNSKYFFDQSLKIGKKIIGDLYNFAVSKISAAIKNYDNTMQQTYTLIQSYNNYTVKQYDALFNRLKKSIDDSGLSSIININELQQSYANTVQGGLFGAAAEKNAYYKQVAEQAGITFDWTDTNWMKTVSRLQKTGSNLDTFMQSIITATENMTEAAGNGFAFTGNQINTMVENLNRLQSSLNLTDEAYIAAYKSFGTAGSMLNEWGIDASKIYADITEYAEKGITSSSTAQILNLGGETQASIREKISSGRTEELVLGYLSELQSRYDSTSGEFINVASSALHESLSNEEILAYQNYVKYLSDNGKSVEDEYNRIYNYDKWAYDNMVESLSNTETELDKITNFTDNFFSSLGKFVNQHPLLGIAGGSLISGLSGMMGGWFSSGLGKNTLQTLLQGDGSTNLNPFKNMFGGSTLNEGFKLGKNGQVQILKASNNGAGPNRWFNASEAEAAGAYTKGGIGGLLKTAFTNGTAFSGSSSSFLQGVGKTVFSTGGKAIGGGLGIAFTANDFMEGLSEGGIGGGFKAMFTGSADTAASGGQVALNALGGAAKGAGIGMMFGPWGAAIGAAIGGLGSLAIGLNDLSDVTKQSKAAIEATNKMFNSVSEGLEKFTDKQKSIEETQKEISELQVGAAPPKDLMDKYPTLTGYLDDAGKVTDKYKDLMEQLLEVERKKNADELAKLYYDEQSEAGWDNVEKSFGQSDKEKLLLDAVKDKNTNISYNPDAQAYVITDSSGKTSVVDRRVAENLGITWDTIQGMKADEGSETYTQALDTVNSAELIYNDDYAEALTAARETASSYSGSMSSWFTGYGEDPTKPIPKDRASYLYKKLQSSTDGRWDKDFSRSLINYNNALLRLKDAGEDLEKSGYLKPSIMKDFLLNASDFDKGGAVSAVKGMEPAFAVGTIGDATIPYDTLAYLHKGEQVRTAAEVSIAKAEQHVASSDAIGQLNSVVLKQTDAIISLLTQILNVTMGLSGRASKSTKGQSYDYSAVPI